MPIQTRIKFKDFLKALEILADKLGIYCKIINKSGSGRRIELFKKQTDKIPYEMFVVHEAKYLYSDDLKKIYLKFDTTEKEFQEIIDSI